jgi:DNA-binding transcriptional MerR regulator
MCPSPRARSDAQDEPAGKSVGQIAALLGVAPETIRSWGLRYGLVASGHTPGGHRRFTPEDVATLQRMQDLVATGATPADAARACRAGIHPGDLAAGQPSAARPTRGARRAAPGGRVLAVPGGSAQARGLARAASRLDAATASGIIGELLVDQGVVQTWENTLVPVLRAAGKRWSETGDGVDIEHVLAEAIIDSLRAYSAFLPRAALLAPVLLADAPEDTHSLPLHAIAAALREHRRPSLLLGARVPLRALTAAALRTGATGVFVWRQIDTSEDTTAGVIQLRRSLRPACRLVLGGPGWLTTAPAAGIARPHTLGAAVAALVQPPGSRR